MTKRTADLMRVLGEAMGRLYLHNKLDDDLYLIVHRILDSEYGDYEAEYNRFWNDDIVLFYEGWQAGRHESKDPEQYCSLPFCRCSQPDIT